MKIRTPIKPMVIREKSYALHFAVIAALWLLAMTLDYRDQMQESQRAAETTSAHLAACLNGKAAWKDEDGNEVGCFKAETNERLK